MDIPKIVTFLQEEYKIAKEQKCAVDRLVGYSVILGSIATASGIIRAGGKGIPLELAVLKAETLAFLEPLVEELKGK